jgi:hypothetical protein
LVYHPKGKTQIEMCENEVLRGTPRPKRNKVKGEWKKLQMRNFIHFILIKKCHSGDQIKDGERMEHVWSVGRLKMHPPSW